MFSFFQDNPMAFVFAALVMGLCIGSFLNVVIYRLPIMFDKAFTIEAKNHLGIALSEEEVNEKFNLVYPASACPKCKEHVRAWQNIPLISYLFLKGKCFYCKNPIGIRYPLVELLTGVLFFVAAYHFGPTWQGIFALLFTALLVAMAFIDADTQLLLDQLTLPFLWFGLLASLFPGSPVAPEQAIVGAIVGYMFLWTIFWVFKILTGRDGMGYGDFKLLAALGAWLGVAPLLIVILLSAGFGLVFAFITHLGKRKPMPFGPYLACGGWTALLYGKQILSWIYPDVQF